MYMVYVVICRGHFQRNDASVIEFKFSKQISASYAVTFQKDGSKYEQYSPFKGGYDVGIDYGR